MKLKLSKGYSSRGADMGRPSQIPAQVEGKLHLHKLPLDSGGYDAGGAYWGFPDNLYVAWGENVFMTTRAINRNNARENILAHLPGALFYR